MPHVDGPPVQSPPAPVEYRDPSTGVRQSDVDSLVAAARAKGDANYLAKVIEAARNDGFAVPDAPGVVQKIVKQPQDAASYSSATDGSHWGLSEREAAQLRADLIARGVDPARVDGAFKESGYSVESAPYVTAIDAEWASLHGSAPSSPAGYDVNLAAPGNDQISPQDFRDLHTGIGEAMFALKLPGELAKSFVADTVQAASAWKQAQTQGPQAEREHIQAEQLALVRAIGSTKVAEALHDTQICRDLIRKANPQFERILNASGFFVSARNVV